MKKSLFWMLGALAVSGLFTFSACEEDETTPVGVCDNNPCAKNTDGKIHCHDVGGTAVCSVLEKCSDGLTMKADGLCSSNLGGEGASCKNSDECAHGLSCEKGRCSQQAEMTKYKHVRIDDMSQTCEAAKCGEDPGADIDAIVLKKGGNDANLKYAASVTGYKRSDGKQSNKADNAIATNAERALGKPDSFISYPNLDQVCYYWAKNTHPSDNNQQRTYVSLGGQGGYLIVEMEDTIEANDTLDVLEIGDCKLWNTTDKKGAEYENARAAEQVKVQISINGDAEGTWKLVGQGSAKKGIITHKITADMVK